MSKQKGDESAFGVAASSGISSLGKFHELRPGKIHLKCTACGNTRSNMDRSDFDPANAVVMTLNFCPCCDKGGGFEEAHYYDSTGAEITEDLCPNGAYEPTRQKNKRLKINMKTQENGRSGALALDAWLGLSISDKLRIRFPKPCKPRKAHHCRLCGGKIEVGEPCCKWEYLEPGEGYGTSHAHPECYQYTLDAKWDAGDWECVAPGDISRPNNRASATPKHGH